MTRSSIFILACVALFCVLVIGYQLLQSEPELSQPEPALAVLPFNDETIDPLVTEPEDRDDRGRNDLMAAVDSHIESVEVHQKPDLGAIRLAPETDEVETIDAQPEEGEIPTLTLGSGPPAQSALMRLSVESRSGPIDQGDIENVIAQLPETDSQVSVVPNPEEEPEAPPRVGTYTIQPRDTFSSIAEKLYGSEQMWLEIAQVNPGLDPRNLESGRVIKLPSSDSPQRSEPSPADLTRHLVRSGDTLWSISKRCYGDSEQWRAIYRANRDVIGQDPDRLEAGTWLTIPPALSGSVSP